MDTKDRTEALHISEDADGSRQVVLHPSDHDLFVRTGVQIIEACRLRISLDVWVHECESMSKMVATWAEGHAETVSACYAVARPSGIALFFVPKSESFDFDLAGELVDLDRKVQEFNVGPVDIYQIPNDELPRFVAQEDCFQVY